MSSSNPLLWPRPPVFLRYGIAVLLVLTALILAKWPALHLEESPLALFVFVVLISAWVGGEATDFVLLVMNEGGARGILNSKVKLGADASVAAGPVGRDSSAESDATLRAEILSYSRARGVFAGVSLEGSTIRPDNGDNRHVYGRKIPARDIVLSGTVAVPPAAAELISTLAARTPKHRA